MNYGIIGIGKVGNTLAKFFYKKKQLAWVCDNGFDFEILKKKYKIIQSYNDFKEINTLPDVIFLTVNDSSIKTLAKKIAQKFKHSLKDKIIIHTSGILPYLVLNQCEKHGAIIAKAHPYQTFSKSSVNSLKGVPWGIHTNQNFDLIAEIIRFLGGNPIDLSISNVNDILYHSSAVATSNFFISPLILGKLLAEKAGVNPSDFMKKISSSALKNTLDYCNGSKEFPLTGPIIRGDVGSIKSHIKELSNEPQLLKIYTHLALATIEIAYYYGFISNEIKTQFEKIFLIERF